MGQSAVAPSRNSATFTQRKIAWMPVWLLLTANLYWLFWLHKTYKEIRQHSDTATTITPGQAVGYLFIPFFNIYWFFRIVVDFPRALARVQAEAAPTAEPLSRGRVTGMMIVALVLNTLAGYFHPTLFVGGEILLAAAFITCQKSMKISNEKGSAEVHHSFAELIGARGPSIGWGRVAAFALACFVSVLLVSFEYRLVIHPKEMLAWQTAGRSAVLAVFAAGGTVVAFRFIRNEWLAALVGAGVFAIGDFGVGLMQGGRLPVSSAAISSAFQFVSQFLMIAAIAFFLHLTRSMWKAVLLGVAFGEFTDTVASVIVSRETWYVGFADWLRHPAPEPGSFAYIGNMLGFLQPVFDLQTALVFTFVMWLAYKLWVHEGVPVTGVHA